MTEFPKTSASLIARIKNPENVVAWADFERLYRPVIFRTARAKGLQYADASDLVQQVLMSVAGAIEKYEQLDDGPPFRNWLSRITKNAILKSLTRRPQDQASGGTGILDVLSEVAAPDRETGSLIDNELRSEIFAQAAEKVRSLVQPTTWLAFEMSVLDQQSVTSVSQALKISVGNVYAARSRVVKQLKEIVKNLEFESER